MADRRRYVSNEYYRLPPIGETVPVDVTRRYRNDREGYPGYSLDWTAPELQRTPYSSFTDSKRLFSRKFVPSVVDRLAPDYLSTSVRGMGMINPQIGRARDDIRLRREDIPARFSSYPAPRFSQIPTAFLSQSFPNDGGQFADDCEREDRRFALPYSYSRPTRPASPRPYRRDTVRAESQSDPFYPLGCTSRLPPLPGANRSLDRLVQNSDNFAYSRNMGRPKVKDPLSCKCCQDINKINLYNQRLGRATRYPLQATVPQIENKMAARRREKQKQKLSQCTFSDRRDSEQDEIDKQF